MGEPTRNEWLPRRSQVDVTLFDGGRIGPFVVGKTIRDTLFGDVRMALEDGVEHIVEIERFDVFGVTELEGFEEGLMLDLASTTEFRHRHVAEVTGAGLIGGVPYVVRPHRLGRMLSKVVERSTALSSAVVAVIGHSIGEALVYLAFEGSSVGAWSLGGFDERDVFLGFDGSILVTGAGLKRLRSLKGDPTKADRDSLLALIGRLDGLARGEVLPRVTGAHGLEEIPSRLRQGYRDDIIQRSVIIGSLLREHFGEEILGERAYLGMSTLH